MLSTPLQVLFPKLEKSDQAAEVLGGILEGYHFGSRELLEEIMIKSRHHYLKQQVELADNQKVKNAKNDTCNLITLYGV